MRYERDHAAGSNLAGGPRCPQKRPSGADQIVDHECGRTCNVFDEEVARNHAGAAMLIGECLADRTVKCRFQRLAK